MILYYLNSQNGRASPGRLLAPIAAPYHSPLMWGNSPFMWENSPFMCGNSPLMLGNS